MKILRVSSLFGALVVLAACGPGGQITPPAPEEELTFPKPDHGHQLMMGPFDVPPGEEVQLCQTMKLDNDEPIAVDKIESLKLPGSHHVILFASDQDVPDQTFYCWGTIDFDVWRFVFDNQEEDISWQLPKGKGFMMRPHQQVMIQSHYQNATNTKSPLGGKVYLNLHTKPVAGITPVYGAFAVNRRIELPPNSLSGPFYRDCDFNRAAKVIGLYGHFHSRGRKFTVNKMSSIDTGAQIGERADLGRLYESESWTHPPMVTAPGPELGEEGIDVGAGESLRWGCSYQNDTDRWFWFGSHADVAEHCNFFFFYYLTDDSPSAFQCSQGAGGW
jgi:hypothetical protein